jgi:hypothetical protein
MFKREVPGLSRTAKYENEKPRNENLIPEASFLQTRILSWLINLSFYLSIHCFLDNDTSSSESMAMKGREIKN